MLAVFAERLACSAWRRHLLFLVATSFAVVFAGYHFGTFDQTIHIPFLKKYVDPTLYPNDAFLELRFQHYSYFWFFFQPIYRLGLLNEVMFVVHFLATYATFWALWTLSLTLFASPLAALLSTVAFAFPHLGFAGFPIIEFSLLNRTFVLPFLLLAITLFLRRRYILAFAVLGLMYNLHVISVQFVLAMFLFAGLLSWRRIGWRNLVLGMAVFLAGAMPVLAWKLGGSPVDLTPRPEWFSLVARGTLYNLFYLLPPYPHILIMTLSGLSALLMFIIARRHNPSPQHDRTVTHFIYAALIILVIQVITAQWLPITIIVQSQIIRAGLFVLIFGYLYFAKLLADRYLRRTMDRLSFATLTGAYVGFTLPIAPVITWAMQRSAPAVPWRRVLVWTVLLTLFVTTMGVAIGYNGWHPGIHLYGPRTSWEAAQRWARDNTARDAVFVTPPHIWWLYQSDWRVFSERSTLVTLADLLEVAFMPEYVPTWRTRFEAVAPGAIEQFRGDFFENKRITAEAFYSLSEADFQRLAGRFGVDYLVVEKPHAYAFPVVYENEGYRIYDLQTPFTNGPSRAILFHHDQLESGLLRRESQ